VAEFFPRRHVGLTEPGKVRRNDVKFVSKKRDQVAEHVACARETMQEQQLGRALRSRIAIEELETVDIGRAIFNGGHQTLLSLDDFCAQNAEAAYLWPSLLLDRESLLLEQPYGADLPPSKSLEPSRWPVANS